MTTIERIIKGPRLPAGQSNSAYAWLSMLVFFVWKYVAHHGNMTEIVLAIVTLLVFLGLYFANFWCKGATSYVLVLSIAALGLVWAPVNPGSSVFVVFSAACCSSIKPNRYAYACLAFIIGMVVLEVTVLNLSSDFWVPALLVSCPIGVATIMQSSLRQSQQKLLRSQEEVAHMATIAERERISRDLHDLLGHTLSLITIKAELAGKLIGRDVDACRQEIVDIEKTARNALSEVRAAVTGYRQVGFAHELANAASCLGAADIGLKTDIEELQLSAAAENILSLTLREAVTNVARHSHARQCSIRLSCQGNWVLLQISDDGKLLADSKDVKPGNGLTGMRERVAGIGGQIIFEIKQGLSLEVRLPKEHSMQTGAQV